MLSQNLCNKYEFIPFGFNENKIKVALSDPSNIFAIDDISIATGFDVESYISPKWQIRKFIEVYYNKQQIDKVAEKRLPQDGRIITTVGDSDVDLRVSVLPIVNGEKIVIRILNRNSYQIGKEKLGMKEKDLKKLENIISSPNGIVLVTGPTGSGKSTTLYTILSELNTNKVNIITVEDPVEYTLKGVNQVNVNVNTKAGLTFPSGLRSILRQDLDIIMIGEIRDDETAEIAVRAAITGHLVLSTNSY